MSFYIGFVTKDLITLAADRKFSCGEKCIMSGKLLQLTKNSWGVHIGAKFFGERWLYILSHLRPKWLINTCGGLKLISCFMYGDYVYYQEKMKKEKYKLEGFTNIALAGFRKGEPFIYAMDSSTRFMPMLCSVGSIYNCIDRKEKSIDLYINIVTRALGGIQKEGIDRQKIFLRTHIPKIFKYLSEKYDSISASGDVVFIMQDSSAKESFPSC